MRIGLYGGSFDPPHLGHQRVVQEVLAHRLFDEVWYIPVGNHDFGKQMSPAADRIAMLKLIVAPRTKIELSEVQDQGVSYTHKSLRRLAAKYPSHKFAWIMGSDQLASLFKWGCDQERACFPHVLEEFPFYVYPRTGYPMELPYPGLQPLTNVTEVDVSSTAIRELVKQGGAITGLVDPKIDQYIRQRGLYA